MPRLRARLLAALFLALAATSMLHLSEGEAGQREEGVGERMRGKRERKE